MSAQVKVGMGEGREERGRRSSSSGRVDFGGRGGPLVG